jgi:hypothetical protein
MSKRPPTLTVPAILFLIFEIFALFGVLSSGVMMMVSAKLPGELANPALAAMNDSPVYALYMKIMLPVSLIVGSLGIAVAIGLFKGKELARKGGIWLSLFKVVSTTIATWMTVVYVNPAMEKYMAATMAKAGQGQDTAMIQSTMKIASLVGAIGGTLFWLALSVAMIILLTRPSAKAWCLRDQLPPATPPPFQA